MYLHIKSPVFSGFVFLHQYIPPKISPKNKQFFQIDEAVYKAHIDIQSEILKLQVHFFSSSFFLDIDQQSACAVAYGFASKSHLALVTEKLEALLKAEFSKKRGLGPSSFFGFMRDHKLEDEQLATRCTILRCVGSAAFKGQDLKSKADEMCQKFIMPAMQSALPTLKVAALKVKILEANRSQNRGLPLFFLTDSYP